MKKGRHRRFEEARKLKQSGPGAFDLGFGDSGRKTTATDDDGGRRVRGAGREVRRHLRRRRRRRRLDVQPRLLGQRSPHRRGAAAGSIRAVPTERPSGRRSAAPTSSTISSRDDHVDRLRAAERLGRLGAPPVELGAAVAPVAPLPLAQPRGDVAVVVGGVLEPDRHLPAHVGLPVERALAGLERRRCAARTRRHLRSPAG